MKKLINQAENTVDEMIDGLAAASAAVIRLKGTSVLLRTDWPADPARPVALISGGGSGHEPAHAGYVGHGMLTAAVSGQVFTSPSTDMVMAAIRAIAGPKGVLLILKNYTGDRLNFGHAAELARADGIAVESVVVADDVALSSSIEHAGRRGIAGTVLVHKVAGAAAAAGLGLTEVAGEAREAAENVRTMGVALSACTVPSLGRASFVLSDDEVELGLGIHGEPGVRRVPIAPADALVDQLIKPIAADLKLAPRDRCVLLVNNLGATTMMELAIVARHAISLLKARSILIERAYIGTFLTALDMAGISISVMKVNDQRLARLDARTDAPAWPNASNHSIGQSNMSQPFATPVAEAREQPIVSVQTPLGHLLKNVVQTVAHAIVASQQRLDSLDQAVGDGDLGTSLARGARAIMASANRLPWDDPSLALREVAQVLGHELGGTSGPLHAVFVLRLACGLKDADCGAALVWLVASRRACQALSELGGAKLGDRTILDAIIPALDDLDRHLQESQPLAQALSSAANVAESAAQGTAQMLPRKGRSSYLGPRAIGHADPGAVEFALILRSIADCVSTSQADVPRQ